MTVSVIQLLDSDQHSDVLPTVVSAIVVAASIGFHAILLTNCVKTYKDNSPNGLRNNANPGAQTARCIADKEYIWPKYLYDDLKPTTYCSLYPLILYLRLSVNIVVICLSQVSIDPKFCISSMLLIHVQLTLFTMPTNMFTSQWNFAIQSISNVSMTIILLLHHWNMKTTEWSQILSYTYISVFPVAFTLINVVTIMQILT